MFSICVPSRENRIFYWNWNDTFTAAHTVFTSDPVDYSASWEADSRSAVHNYFFTCYAIVSFTRAYPGPCSELFESDPHPHKGFI